MIIFIRNRDYKTIVGINMLHIVEKFDSFSKNLHLPWEVNAIGERIDVLHKLSFNSYCQ